ncbi:MAG: hypothetical protein DMF62_05935 [Acidobacteria bacterium]|nr:MAG: hypothetical protein DMF62_05935 [Acidobacteriota bacterium]
MPFWGIKTPAFFTDTVLAIAASPASRISTASLSLHKFQYCFSELFFRVYSCGFVVTVFWIK